LQAFQLNSGSCHARMECFTAYGIAMRSEHHLTVPAGSSPIPLPANL
jgi:hypothetical protein